ncbi:MAG: hypothetical protein ACI32O_07845 [Enterococcus sp.]
MNGHEEENNNPTYIKKAFLAMFSYNNEKKFNAELNKEITENVREVNSEKTIESVLEQLIPAKQQNINVQLEINQMEQEISILKMRDALLQKVVSITPDEKASIKNICKVEQDKLQKIEKTLKEFKAKLEIIDKEEILEATSKKQLEEATIALSRIHRFETATKHDTQREVKLKELDALREKIRQAKDHTQTLKAEVSSAKDNLSKIVIIERNLRGALEKKNVDPAMITTDASTSLPEAELTRSNSFSGLKVNKNDTPATLKMKLQQTTASKATIEKIIVNKQEQVDGITSIVEPSNAKVLESLASKQFTEAASQTTNELEEKLPRKRRGEKEESEIKKSKIEPSIAVTPEPHVETKKDDENEKNEKDEIDRALDEAIKGLKEEPIKQNAKSSEKSLHPIDKNAIIKSTPDINKLKKELGELGTKEPIKQNEKSSEKSLHPIDANVIIKSTPDINKLKKELEEAVTANFKARAELLQVQVNKLNELLKHSTKNGQKDDKLHPQLKEQLAIFGPLSENMQEILKDPAKLAKYVDEYSTPDVKEMLKIIETSNVETTKINEQIKELKALDFSQLKQSFLRESLFFRLFRWTINLWPFAVYPFLPSFLLASVPFPTDYLYQVPSYANAVMGFVCASYFGSKVLVFANEKIPALHQTLVEKMPKTYGALSHGLGLAITRLKSVFPTRQKGDQAKEETLSEGMTKTGNVKIVELSADGKEISAEGKIIPKQTDISVKGTPEIAETQPKEGIWDKILNAPRDVVGYVWKNKVSVAIMVLLPIALGVGGMYAMSAVFPALAFSLAMPYLAQIGTFALIGVGIGVGVQLVDRLVLKPIENHIVERENKSFEQKINEKSEEVQEIGKNRLLDSQEFRDKVTILARGEEKVSEQVKNNEQQKTPEINQTVNKEQNGVSVKEMPDTIKMESSKEISSTAQPSTSQLKTEQSNKVSIQSKQQTNTTVQAENTSQENLKRIDSLRNASIQKATLENSQIQKQYRQQQQQQQNQQQKRKREKAM